MPTHSVEDESPSQRSSEASGAIVLDRSLVRFVAVEIGGAESPRFITERELSLGARIEALADQSFRQSDERPFLAQHVVASIERHIAESILAALPIEPRPTVKEITERFLRAKVALAARAGGSQAVSRAVLAEGGDGQEFRRMGTRFARASIYLERMVAPMVRPSRSELLSLHRRLSSPYMDRNFSEVEAPFESWYLAERMASIVRAFYNDLRQRVRFTILVDAKGFERSQQKIQASRINSPDMRLEAKLSTDGTLFSAVMKSARQSPLTVSDTALLSAHSVQAGELDTLNSIGQSAVIGGLVEQFPHEGLINRHRSEAIVAGLLYLKGRHRS